MTNGSDGTGDQVRVKSVVERKDPSLPRFIAVPRASIEAWGLESTTSVLVEVDGVSLGRRSLKSWPDRDAWFFDLTAAHCREAGLETGDRVEVGLRPADSSPPSEILDLLQERPAAREHWDELTPARRRAISEHVRAGKREETRRRRARSALDVGPRAG